MALMESESESKSTSRKATLANCFGPYAANGYGQRIRIMDWQLVGTHTHTHTQKGNVRANLTTLSKAFQLEKPCVYAILTWPKEAEGA